MLRPNTNYQANYIGIYILKIFRDIIMMVKSCNDYWHSLPYIVTTSKRRHSQLQNIFFSPIENHKIPNSLYVLMFLMIFFENY